MEHTGNQAPAAPEQPIGGGDGGRPPRRWLKAVIVFLLIAIPAGYLYISALQSRGGGGDKEEQATDGQLEEGWPSRLQRRIYGMSVPYYATGVAHYEDNSWKSSSLYLQFTTTPAKFDKWLKSVGTNASALKDGEITIDADEAAVVGWKFGSGHHWKGTVHKQGDRPRPELEITANMDDPKHPKVYVVSTTTP
ncbi:hypothetical protein AB0A70_16025 [Streptomyces morookaense]|uniref:hypothetical protein n=1 Tax=Streptomyces morookaense TaxID=1970 RepID=UPI0034114BF1